MVVQAVTQERVGALDDHLWTYAEDSFLPHAGERDASAAEEPIVLTTSDANPNGATVRFLIEGAPLPERFDGLSRLVLVFDGGDDAALAARARRMGAAAQGGAPAYYWQQDDDGRWQKKA